MKKTTGERIKDRRKELGMTADKLAQKIGVSRSTIFRYENGFIEKLPINSLVPIARALSTTVGALMGWENEKMPAFNEDGLEKDAMFYFDALPDNKKAEALDYLRYLASTSDNK